jgi:aminoglycoside phosphotransferase (APT) family kinase protein
MHDPTGFEVSKLTAWLDVHVPGLIPPFQWTRLSGGHSNFTYRIDDAAGRILVLRRPPLGELLPTAHDMAREFAVISGLWGTAVPVPEPIAYCDDDEVVGAPFYAMGWVEGRSLFTSQDAEEHLNLRAREQTGISFIDTLSALHALQPEAVGLGEFGQRGSYVARQLHRWYGSWNASKNRDLAEVDWLHNFLINQLPDQPKVSVVHGDYGLHNCRVAADGHIAAVIDWEISTLGDPLADLGYCINGWVESTEEVSGRDPPPTVLAGFSTRQQLLARYAKRSGADLSYIEYYRCFSYWKYACIVQGVYARYLHGQKDLDQVDMHLFPERIRHTLQLAVEMAESMPS